MAAPTQAEMNEAIDLLIDNNIEFIKPALLRQVLRVITSGIAAGDPSTVSATSPLVYDPFTNTFYMPKAGPNADGYLDKVDFLRIRLVPFGDKSLFKGPDATAGSSDLEVDDVASFIYKNSDDVPTFFIGAYKGGDPTDIDNNWTLIMSNPYK